MVNDSEDENQLWTSWWILYILWINFFLTSLFVFSHPENFMFVEAIYLGLLVYRTQLFIIASVPVVLKSFPYFHYHSSATFITIAVIFQEGRMLVSVMLMLNRYVTTEYGMAQMSNHDRTYTKHFFVLFIVCALMVRNSTLKLYKMGKVESMESPMQKDSKKTYCVDLCSRDNSNDEAEKPYPQVNFGLLLSSAALFCSLLLLAIASAHQRVLTAAVYAFYELYWYAFQIQPTFPQRRTYLKNRILDVISKITDSVKKPENEQPTF